MTTISTAFSTPFSPEESGVYAYTVNAHDLTCAYGGTRKGKDPETVVKETRPFDPASPEVNPDRSQKSGFAYQPERSTLFVGTEQKTEQQFPAGKERTVAVSAANQTCKVDLHYKRRRTFLPVCRPQPPAR